MHNKLTLIQVLRGLAAFLVVLFHFEGASDFFYKCHFLNVTWGWTGVDIFFVLSGFIITYIHFNDIVNKGSFKEFVKKRFIRIYPMYWVALITVLIIAFASKGVIKGTHEKVYILNLHSLDSWFYLIKNISLYPVRIYALGVAWTLTYEVIFYFVFALCILFGLKFLKYFLPFWISLIVINSFYPFPGDITYLASPRILEFLLGCVVGYAVKFHFNKKTIYLFLCGFLLLSLPGIFTNNLLVEVGLLAFFTRGCIGALIILAAIYVERTKNFKVPRTFTRIGDASYVLYLFHNRLINLGFHVGNLIIAKFHIHLTYIIRNVYFTLLIIATIGMAILIHLLIEKPLLSFLNNNLLKKKPGIKPSLPKLSTAY